jgi:hypothetical protein
MTAGSFGMGDFRLTTKQVAEVRRIRRNLRSGKTRLATDAEVADFKKRLIQ